jgi:hypothetical protein
MRSSATFRHEMLRKCWLLTADLFFGLPAPNRCLASALAQLGREAEANEAIARLLELQPNFRISEWVARDGLSRTQMMYIDGLRKAGVPE